jgi:LmbE family N-acetylglucosaminyl deacetylase
VRLSKSIKINNIMVKKLTKKSEIPQNKKIIVFSPHPDDDAIGMGGTIIELVKNGNKVLCVYITSGVSARNAVKGDMPVEEKEKIRRTEAERASKILGANIHFLNIPYFHGLTVKNEHVEKIIKLLEKENPDVIFAPHKHERHPTHKASMSIVLRALERCNLTNLNEIWFYEIVTPIRTPNIIITFGKEVMEKKIEAIKAHKSQIDRRRYDIGIKGLNTFRGILKDSILGVGYGSLSSKEIIYGEAFIKTSKQI